MPPSRYKPRSLKRIEKKAKRNLFLSIIIFLVFTYFLISWGLPTLIGGLSVFNRFKPSAEKEIIDDTGLAPPVLNIPYEATNSASLRISGYSTAKSEVVIYINDQEVSNTSTNSDGTFETSLNLSPGTNYIYGITKNEDKKSLPSKTIKLNFSDEKPKLEVSEPTDNQQIKGGDKKIKVTGKVDNQNPVTINGITVIVDSEGNFSKEVSLNDGDNQIVIVATNEVGNTQTVEKKVNYTP